MALTVLLGGARSGKSALAVRLAAGWEGPVTVVVTGEARDAEMAERIRRHRAERPGGWDTVEAPRELEAALAGAPADAFVLLDCLTVWVANLMEQGLDDEQVMGQARSAAAVAAARTAPTVAVSNEVGAGIVPADALSRRYRDLLGQVNAAWAAAADRALLLVAGRAVPLLDPLAALGAAGDTGAGGAAPPAQADANG
jgi:adenosylcobinamide kinase / adenosylcobinamide-phosphate guanylyltransferase